MIRNINQIKRLRPTRMVKSIYLRYAIDTRSIRRFDMTLDIG